MNLISSKYFEKSFQKISQTEKNKLKTMNLNSIGSKGLTINIVLKFSMIENT